ncbi:ATP-binding protein [Streptomyces sp. Act143]|uniref:ATP-binding protein n=1 Tax=Streptomyces sp. Act143 TaxID=2200760 RepID=UPI0015E80EB2|nr:ATP-binding protein [Streptomyces sp. Act143]
MFRRVPESVPAARRFACTAVTDWKLPDLVDSAELAVSELASNAVLHARREVFRVTVRLLDDGQVRVAVVDFSRTLPKRTAAGDDEIHGRGLALVEAVSRQWGAEPLPWGKRVWADLQAPDAVPMPDPDVPIFSSPRAQVVYVLILLAVAAAVLTGMAAHY